MSFKTLAAALLLVAFCQSTQAAQLPARTNGATNDVTKSATTKSTITLPPEKASPVRVPRLEKPPVVDGKLSDEAWKNATLLKDFYQTQPGDNIAPSQQTEVLLGYDSTHFYIAFRAYDEPGKVRATVPRRDSVFDDDTVQVVLDTYNDKRKAYILVFNPLGVQADGIMTEGERGTEEDYSLDIVMESKGKVGEDGYVVEIAIPFKSLRYEAGNGKLWGFHAFRRIKRLDNEFNSWMPISRDKTGLLNQEGQITGLDGISTERTLEIIPTLTLSESGRRVRMLSVNAVTNNPALYDPGRFVNSPVKADPGLSLKLGITPTVTLDFAANPDFAQVEADQPVITANQRFPIFFSEKRPFFLEGADIFQTPIQAVHTRAIIDPDYAVKLTGKQGRNTFGVLLASDNAPGSYSEEEISDPEIFPQIEKFVEKNAYIGILRYKRDVGKESSLGLIATSYNFIEKHNQLAGIDGRFKLDSKTVFSLQVLGTTSRRYFYEPDKDESIYRTGNAVGYYANLDYTGRNFGYAITGQGRTRDYRADTGFVFRTNTNSYSAFFRFSNDPKPKAKFISWRLHSGLSSNFDWQGRSQATENFEGLNLQFAGEFFVNLQYGEFYERIFEEEFGPKRAVARTGAFFGDSERSTRGRVIATNINKTFSKKYSAWFFMGRRWNVFDYDFGAGPRYPRVSPAALADPNAALDPGEANTFDISAGGDYKPTAALSASLNYQRFKYTRNDTGRVVFVSSIYSLRSTYQFTRFTFLRARLDYDTLSSSVRGQYLFGWTPSPGTSFYVGYNDDLSLGGYSPFTSHREPGFHRNGRTFFIKTSYLFRRSI